MLRKVLEDYRDGFRWSRFKETYHFSMLWMYVYLLAFFPIILDMNEKTELLARYYTMALPLLFGIYSLSAVPIRLPKQMFLCPLNEDEREKYAKTLFVVRLLGPVLFGAVTYSVAAIAGWMDTECLWFEFFGLVSMMICGSITSWPGSTWERSDTKLKRLMNPELKGLYGPTMTGLIAAVSCQLLFTVAWDGKPDMIFNVLMATIGLITIVCDIWVLRYFNPVIKNCITYEMSYDMKHQEEKKV